MSKHNAVEIAKEMANTYMEHKGYYVLRADYIKLAKSLGLTKIGSGVETLVFRHDNSDYVILVSRDPVKNLMSEMDYEYMLNLDYVASGDNEFSFYVAPYIDNVVEDMLPHGSINSLMRSDDIDNATKNIISELYRFDVIIEDSDDLELFYELDIPHTMAYELRELAESLIGIGLDFETDFHFGNYAYNSGKLIILDPFITS